MVIKLEQDDVDEVQILFFFFFLLWLSKLLRYLYLNISISDDFFLLLPTFV